MFNNMQLPVCKVEYIRATWIGSQEELLLPGNNSRYIKVRALGKIIRGDRVVGYYCKDSFNREFAMESEVIKRILRDKNKRVSFYNLKLSSDGKLMHDYKGDRLGLDVPPEVFFRYENIKLGIRMGFDANEKCVILMDIKSGKYLKFRVCTFNNGRAWSLRCYEGNLIDSTKVNICNIDGVVYRDMDANCLDEFIQMVVNKVKNSQEKDTTLEEDEKSYFEQEWSRRFGYLEEYKKGNSEDSEKAYHSLKYLRSKSEMYNKKWDLDF